MCSVTNRIIATYSGNRKEAARRNVHDVTTGTYSSGTPDSEWEGLGHFANSANKTAEVNAIMRDVETYAPHGPFGNMEKKEIVILKVLIACSKERHCRID